MLIKTLLNKIGRFKSSIYGSINVIDVDGKEALVIDIKPRLNSQPICPECGKRGVSYAQRLVECLSIGSFKCYFRYALRRVRCSSMTLRQKRYRVAKVRSE